MDPVEEEEKLPELYSRSSIVIISLITSTVVGAILYAINLNRLNRRKYIFPTILGAILYQVLGARLSSNLSTNYEFVVYMGLNFTGAMLILGLWDMQIGRQINYRPRNTMNVFVIILVLVLILFGLNRLGVTSLPE
ncbi:MAG: hypothetical protein H6561_13060 [Lewinellaceae bacterium]|nr:hypothetical protein [Lewinellaceae bacterium]